jgi:hypothetical protein
MKLETFLRGLENDNWVSKGKSRGLEYKKYRGKGISTNKHSFYKGNHRNGFNETISHEVSPKTISVSHLLLKDLFISYFPRDLSLYLSLLFPV